MAGEVRRLDGLYQRAVNILSRPPEHRNKGKLKQLEDWFRLRSHLLTNLATDTLIDLLMHSQFVNLAAGSVIVRQGERGDTFYIILRGSVSVMVKDSPENSDGSKIDGTLDSKTHGSHVATLAEGDSFGEVALLTDDCMRTATVIAGLRAAGRTRGGSREGGRRPVIRGGARTKGDPGESVDLLVLHRDLYERSIACLVSRDVEQRIEFLQRWPLLADWPPRWKRQLASSLVRHSHSYGSTVVRQGEAADHIVFIISGEVCLVAEPELHPQQFTDLIRHCDGLQHSDEVPPSVNCFSLARWFSGKSRCSRRLKENPGDTDGECLSASLPDHRVTMLPSTIRRKAIAAQIHHKHNICCLEPGQIIGAVEAICDLPVHHVSAVCTQYTEVFTLHRTQFSRWFVRRNPRTYKTLSRTCTRQFSQRINRGHLLEQVPVLRCLLLRLEEVTGNRKRRGRELPALTGQTQGVTASQPPVPTAEETSILGPPQTAPSQRPPAMFPIGASPSQSLPQLPGKGTPEPTRRVYTQTAVKAQVTAVEPALSHEVGHGIFLKLLQLKGASMDWKAPPVSGPTELGYLQALKRRLSTKLDEMHPTVQAQKLHNQDEQPRCAEGAARSCKCPRPHRNHTGVPDLRSAMKAVHTQHNFS